MIKYNSSLVQVYLIGIYATCGPGLFNALTGLGSAGTGNTQTAAIANGCLYGFFTVFGYFGGVLFNTLGPRLCFSLGGLTYAFYDLCIYFTTPDRLYLPAIGGSVLGIGAGMFWCAQSALVMGYATSHEKARFSSLNWTIFNIGGSFGGFLQMALNWKLFNKEDGGIYSLGGLKASTAAYMTFVVIMSMGSIGSFFSLASPSKVIKSDGSPVVIEKGLSVKEDLLRAVKGVGHPFVIRMFVYFLFSNYFYTFTFQYLNTEFFNSRGQGMNSGLYWGAQMVAAMFFSWLIDSFGVKKGWSTKKTVLAGFWLNNVLMIIGWSLALACVYSACNGRVDKTDMPESAKIYALSPAGVEDTSQVLNTLAWFPEVNGQDGCDFLASMRKMQETSFTTCMSHPMCVPNMYTCVEDPYYGKCQMDVAIQSTYPVCSVKLDGDTDPAKCIDLELSFGKQNSLVIITFIIMGLSDSIFQVFCYFLMGKMAGNSVSLATRFAACYKGIQSLGAAIAWASDYSVGYLYRYQIYVNIVVALISTSGVWFTVDMISEKSARDQIEEDAATAGRKSSMIEGGESEEYEAARQEY